MWFFLIVSIALCWYGVFRYRRRRLYEVVKQIEGLPELPILGHSLQMGGNTQTIMSFIKKFSRHAMTTDGYSKLWLGPNLFICVINPIDLEVLLKVCLAKHYLHRFAQSVIGFGAIFAPVSIWRLRRKILVPTFSPKVLEGFVEVFSKQSATLAQRLAEQDGATPFAAWPFLNSYALDSIGETAMGVRIEAQNDKSAPFLKSINQILNLVTKRTFHLWLQPNWLYKLFPDYQASKTNIQVLHNFTDKVIEVKKEQVKTNLMNNNTTEVVDNAFNIKCEKKTFLEMLISSSGGSEGYSNVELREEVLMLIIAGTDTSAIALGYTLLLLAKYPDVQEKVYQELCDVFGKSDRQIFKEDLPKLVYLERVVKETLRLFPPVPIITRKVEEDIKLPSGKVLCAGAGVVVSIWGLHRDSKYWGPDADHFDPDRFLPERFKLQHACSYMPFSCGPRNCIGYQYALMSVKTALAAVLRRCRVLGEPEKGPIPDVDVKYEIMMKPVDDFRIRLVTRT